MSTNIHIWIVCYWCLLINRRSILNLLKVSGGEHRQNALQEQLRLEGSSGVPEIMAQLDMDEPPRGRYRRGGADIAGRDAVGLAALGVGGGAELVLVAAAVAAVSSLARTGLGDAAFQMDISSLSMLGDAWGNPSVNWNCKLLISVRK